MLGLLALLLLLLFLFEEFEIFWVVTKPRIIFFVGLCFSMIILVVKEVFDIPHAEKISILGRGFCRQWGFGFR
jgi:hypothetical protein